MVNSLFQYHLAREKQAAAMRQDAIGSLVLSVAMGVTAVFTLPVYPTLAACALTMAVYFLSDGWTSMDCARGLTSRQTRSSVSL